MHPSVDTTPLGTRATLLQPARKRASGYCVVTRAVNGRRAYIAFVNSSEHERNERSAFAHLIEMVKRDIGYAHAIGVVRRTSQALKPDAD